LAKFNGTLQGVAKQMRATVNDNHGGIIGDMRKIQFAVTDAFAAIGTGFVGLADKMAASNQEMRLGVMHSLMTQESLTDDDDFAGQSMPGSISSTSTQNCELRGDVVWRAVWLRNRKRSFRIRFFLP
jgi:hypothetical protein